MRAGVKKEVVPNEESAHILPAHASRSDSMKLAGEMRAKRIDIKDEELRGVSLTSLLAGGARLFADGGAAARLDPEGTYALSQPVQQLDYFVSHAWRAPRFAKYVALLCYFNLEAAIVAYIVTALVSFVLETFNYEAMPAYFDMDLGWDHSGLAAQVFAPAAFGVVLFTGHLVLRRDERAFLDISCINQLDNASKAAGINSLGALLDRSKRMVVLLDEHNMKRMWCVFEVAAFAKRGSIDRMDLVPLHLALQKGALAMAIILFPLLLVVIPKLSDTTSTLIAMIAVMPVMALAFLLLVHATHRGRSASAALERLRTFTLADAECYSAVDRAAIIELIGRWFADESAVDGGDSQLALDVGTHNFETFVRMEVYAKVEHTLGSARGLRWPATLSLLFWMTFEAHYGLDKIAVPEVPMYGVLIELCSSVFALICSPVFGAGISLTAAAVGHARERCGCGPITSLFLVGLPGTVASWMALLMVAFAPTNPDTFFSNTTVNGYAPLPDDGLEPWSRRVIKVNVGLLAAALSVTIWVSFARLSD